MAKGTYIWGYLKADQMERFLGYANARGITTYRALAELLDRGLREVDRESRALEEGASGTGEGVGREVHGAGGKNWREVLTGATASPSATLKGRRRR